MAQMLLYKIDLTKHPQEAATLPKREAVTGSMKLAN